MGSLETRCPSDGIAFRLLPVLPFRLPFNPTPGRAILILLPHLGAHSGQSARLERILHVAGQRFHRVLPQTTVVVAFTRW